MVGKNNSNSLIKQKILAISIDNNYPWFIQALLYLLIPIISTQATSLKKRQ